MRCCGEVLIPLTTIRGYKSILYINTPINKALLCYWGHPCDRKNEEEKQQIWGEVVNVARRCQRQVCPSPQQRCADYSVDDLKLLKEHSFGRFNEMNFSRCLISEIDELFPKAKKHGIHEPPFEYRETPKMIREWRKMGSKQQQSEIVKRKENEAINVTVENSTGDQADGRRQRRMKRSHHYPAKILVAHQSPHNYGRDPIDLDLCFTINPHTLRFHVIRTQQCAHFAAERLRLHFFLVSERIFF